MMNRDVCVEIVRQLWPYLDDALPDEHRARVIAHLEECGDCRSHFDWECAFLAAVRRTTPDDVSYDLLQQRVLAALSEDGFLSP